MEIKFKRDTSFRKQFFVPDSFAHPAKMDAQLLIWLTENYTSPGETILDPMAGSGTMMLACTLGRNCILVELEEKFCKMMTDNWEEVKMRPQLGYSMGDCQIIQGDARNLEGLLTDKIITSPPYSDISMSGGLNTKPSREGHNDQSGRSSQSPSQLGAGKYADRIITSPPYAEQVQGSRHSDHQPEQRRKRLIKAGYNPDDYQLGKGRQCEVVWEYGKEAGQIGNLPYGNIDKIITSPPYEEAIKNREGDKSLETFAEGYTKGSCIFQSKGGYSNSQDNIGNLKGDTYLEAMLQVYSQCFTVLRDGGLLILVTKNFIRNKQVIRLDEDTIKLCEQAGFSFVERHFRRLPAQSFWRTIYQQKYPDVEVIQNEDILVFKKV